MTLINLSDSFSPQVYFFHLFIWGGFNYARLLTGGGKRKKVTEEKLNLFCIESGKKILEQIRD